jgi:hypothetical protein
LILPGRPPDLSGSERGIGLSGCETAVKAREKLITATTEIFG